MKNLIETVFPFLLITSIGLVFVFWLDTSLTLYSPQNNITVIDSNDRWSKLCDFYAIPLASNIKRLEFPANTKSCDRKQDFFNIVQSHSDIKIPKKNQDKVICNFDKGSWNCTFNKLDFVAKDLECTSSWANSCVIRVRLAPKPEIAENNLAEAVSSLMFIFAFCLSPFFLICCLSTMYQCPPHCLKFRKSPY